MHKQYFNENLNRAAAVKNGLWMLRKELSQLSEEIADLNMQLKVRGFSNTAMDLAILQNEVHNFIDAHESHFTD
jgi:hypothetical protein